MNKVFAILLMVLASSLLWQCAGPSDFEINGTLTGNKSDSLLIQEMTPKGMVEVTRMKLDQTGSFSFIDTAPNPRFLFIRADNIYISVLVLNGQSLEIGANLEQFNESYQVKGSHDSQLIWELNQKMQSSTLTLDSLSKLYQEQKASRPDMDADSWFRRKFQDLHTAEKSFLINFLEKNYASPASLMALSHQLGGQPVLNPASEFGLFAKVDSALSSKYPESPMVANLSTWVKGQRQKEASLSQKSKKTGIGAQAPDFTLNTPDGEPISLSSFQGKYVLLDFWAAWCGPCRRENPTLVRAYDKFNPKGFEILQVSIDRTKEDWLKAIKDDQLNWTHISDLKYWSSPVIKMYYVESIPANFLLDPDGKIIATNLRGPDLEKKLAEIYE